MRRLYVIVGVAAVAGLLAVPSPGSGNRTPSTRPIRTSIYLAGEDLRRSNLEIALRRVRAAGATAVRFALVWASIAPTKPANAADPNDPAYNWEAADREISLARRYGLDPHVTLYYAPRWAGGTRTDPRQFGLFARAAARRYSGSFQGLPRVRVWMAWNEPNLRRYLSPQFQRRRLVSTKRYAKMLNAFAQSVHGVHRDNIVVGGLLAPLNGQHGAGALKFMRSIFCIARKGRHLVSTCRTRLQFDAWAIHPYTSGGPTHRAHGHDGAALGNLPDARAILRAAIRARHVKSSKRVRLWVTEFSWDSKPPDPLGVPIRLETRWVAEALYRTWKAHVPLLTWLQLRDMPRRTNPYQAGLYYRGRSYAKARPKPVLKAFQFPFVAHRSPRSFFVWGRTPKSDARSVSIQLSRGRGWKRIATVRANANGVFFRTFHRKSKPSWFLRAQLAGKGGTSRRFSLRPVPDRYYPAFGS